MKSIIKNNNNDYQDFYEWARKFSRKSMIEAISKIGHNVYREETDIKERMGHNQDYSITILGKRHLFYVTIVQQWLVDLMYKLATINDVGNKTITKEEALHLINLFNCLPENNKSLGDNITTRRLTMYGMVGEQIRMQKGAILLEDFAREKYIIDVVSKKYDHSDINIDLQSLFKKITGYTTTDYSTLLLTIISIFTGRSSVQTIETIKNFFNSRTLNPIINHKNLVDFLDRYSITINEIKNSPIQRQIFYSKPIINIDGTYCSVNPYFLWFSFINSNYWVLRNYYNETEINKQGFINAFGSFFEYYVFELFHSCLKDAEYEKIEECNRKRADWYLTLGEFDILIEQKSCIALLGIKQTTPKVNDVKKYMLRIGKEAIEQLRTTQNDLNLKSPIKLILVYDDYLLPECFDELFSLDPSLDNDHRYWVVNIREMEMLIKTYYENPSLFRQIINDKCYAEDNHILDGRALQYILYKNGVKENKYLKEHGIMDQYEAIINNINSSSPK